MQSGAPTNWAKRAAACVPESLLMLGVAAHDLPGPLAPSVRCSLRTTPSPSCSTATCTGWLNSTLAMARGCKTELEAVAGALSEDLSADGGGGSNCLTALEEAPDRRRRYRRRRDLPGAPGDLPGRWSLVVHRGVEWRILLEPDWAWLDGGLGSFRLHALHAPRRCFSWKTSCSDLHALYGQLERDYL